MNVSEMSAEQVRREIAERVGYKDIFVDPNEAEWWTAILDHEAVPVPDWPNDTAAALALCHQVSLDLWRGNGYLITRALMSDSFMAYFSVFPNSRDMPTKRLIADADTPALALTRLALLALRGEEHGG